MGGCEEVGHGEGSLCVVGKFSGSEKFFQGWGRCFQVFRFSGCVKKFFQRVGWCEKGFSEVDLIIVRTLRKTIRVNKSLSLVAKVLIFLVDRVFWWREARRQDLGRGRGRR